VKPNRATDTPTARTVRFPSKLRAMVADDAVRCGRSFEQQVIAVLRSHYGDDVDLAPSPESTLALARLSVLDISPAEQEKLWGRRRRSG
jgi:hypothetical protein